MKRILICLLALALMLPLASCAGEGGKTDGATTTANTPTATPTNLLTGTHYAEIEMWNGDKITLELYADIAPITVTHFVKLVREGFYDGLIFHRVIEGFMIQGGDPTGTGFGEEGQETIKGEFAANGVKNDLAHTRGVISMARKSTPMDSATSQFFIMHETTPSLDGQYAAFGRVIDGMSAVDAIANTPTDANDRPTAIQKMRAVRMLDEKPSVAE